MTQIIDEVDPQERAEIEEMLSEYCKMMKKILSMKLTKEQSNLRDTAFSFKVAADEAEFTAILLRRLAKRCLECILDNGDPEEFFDSKVYDCGCKEIQTGINELVNRLDFLGDWYLKNVDVD